MTKEQSKPFDFRLLDEAIQIVAHSSEWRRWYEDERQSLFAILGSQAIDIQHVGSSAVPALDAKPIVDIMVGLRKFEMSRSIATDLASIGYEYFGRLHANQERAFARKRSERSFNLQLVPFESQEWKEKIAFRDYLLTHPEAVERYATCKRTAIREGHHTLLSYHKYKDLVVVELLKKALVWNAQQEA